MNTKQKCHCCGEYNLCVVVGVLVLCHRCYDSALEYQRKMHDEIFKHVGDHSDANTIH